MPPRKRKKPEELTTNEAVDALFHPEMAEALRDEIADHDTGESIEDDDA